MSNCRGYKPPASFCPWFIYIPNLTNNACPWPRLTSTLGFAFILYTLHVKSYNGLWLDLLRITDKLKRMTPVSQCVSEGEVVFDENSLPIFLACIVTGPVVRREKPTTTDQYYDTPARPFARLTDLRTYTVPRLTPYHYLQMPALQIVKQKQHSSPWSTFLLVDKCLFPTRK